MQCAVSVVRLISVGILGCVLLESPRSAVADKPVFIERPDAFKTLVNPACSYCITEAKRRAGELELNDPVLAWTRSNHEGGETKSRWDIAGRAKSGPLKTRTLRWV